MKKTNFMKSLLLHIRYPWTAACLFILWLGLAIICAILQPSVTEITGLACGAGVVTLIISLVGFRN